MEALRRENELLKVNLRVTLEKIEALEKQVAGFKGEAAKKNYAEHLRRAQLLTEQKLIAENQRAIAEAEAVRAMALQQRVIAEIEAKRIAEKERAITELEANNVPSPQSALAEAEVLRAIQTLSKVRGNPETVEALEKALKKLRAEQKDPNTRP